MIFPWDKIWEVIDKKIDDKVNAKLNIYFEGLEDRRYNDARAIADQAQQIIRSELFQGLEVETVAAPNLADVTLDAYQNVKNWWERLLSDRSDPIFGSELPFSQLYGDYAHSPQGGVLAPIGQSPFGKYFWKICPGVTSVTHKGAIQYSIPDVEYCRQDFVNYTGKDQKWDGTLYRVGQKTPPKYKISHSRTPLDEKIVRDAKTLLLVASAKDVSRILGIKLGTVYGFSRGLNRKDVNPWPANTADRARCYDLLDNQVALNV